MLLTFEALLYTSSLFVVVSMTLISIILSGNWSRPSPLLVSNAKCYDITVHVNDNDYNVNGYAITGCPLLRDGLDCKM